MAAASGGHDDGVPILHMADTTGKGPSGEGMMAVAWAQENLEAVELLLKEGADIDRSDNDGRTALMLAAGMISKRARHILICQY